MKFFIISIQIILLCFFTALNANAQKQNLSDANLIALQSDNAKKIELDEKKSTSSVKYKENTSIKKNSLIREEIQRYLGFETLFTRYITVPYDITMNTNVAGYYIDIGYIILMFLPIILIIGLKTRPIYGIITIITSFIFLILSTSNGIIIKNNFTRFDSNKENLLKFSSKNEVDGIIDLIISEIYYTFEIIAQPINNFIDNTFSGNADYVTYPILILAFVALFFILEKRLQNSDKLLKLLAFITLLFLFLCY